MLWFLADTPIACLDVSLRFSTAAYASVLVVMLLRCFIPFYLNAPRSAYAELMTAVPYFSLVIFVHGSAYVKYVSPQFFETFCCVTVPPLYFVRRLQNLHKH